MPMPRKLSIELLGTCCLKTIAKSQVVIDTTTRSLSIETEDLCLKVVSSSRWARRPAHLDEQEGYLLFRIFRILDCMRALRAVNWGFAKGGMQKTFSDSKPASGSMPNARGVSAEEEIFPLIIKSEWLTVLATSWEKFWDGAPEILI